ncbi:MAG: hypothetical protein ABFR82_04780 [Nitrospirota bacterium]
MSKSKSYEYINKFLYFVIRPDKNSSTNELLYCSGAHLFRFLPITKGRHRPMSNPVSRGLQLVNLGVRSLVLAHGAIPKSVRGGACDGSVARGDGWYKEHLIIRNAPDSLPEEIINYAVLELLRKIDRAIMLGADLPDTLLKPDKLQVFIEGMCRKYGS